MRRTILLTLAVLLVTACGGSGNGGSVDAAQFPADPPPPTMTITTTLTGTEVIGGGDMSAAASAELVLNLDDGGVSGTVTFQGAVPTAVTLNEGFAGERGDPALFVLDAVDASTFELPAGAALSASRSLRCTPRTVS